MSADLPVDRAADLVVAARRGDTLALAELVDLLDPYVGRICGSVALDAGADAAQDTLIIVLRRLGSLSDPRALFGWVRTIALREALRHARSERGSGDDRLAAVPAPGDPVLAADIRDVLRRLSPVHRAVLVLRDLEGLDEERVAEVLSVPTGTVKSRLHRARAAFRKAWTS
ncbi:RNA polymerase sigma factor [Saccharothrix variisporea]|uniref:RNA polymerase sigma-70 factor (ECF subfamily) n=1 Tax=Saccharothrix variisporea TaxID=543527 RepID=A0A495X926_9PSEU|nr:sigma-70 family RNA polymerase sigma factor [Saccharothrix variisporea]RKT70971.1 RNA polymerase sigma-70 factor (ECF subfamily) [Saccharothrix variisporea]